MPIHKRPYEKGNLYIKFDVVFPEPKSFKPAQLQQLAAILPPRNPSPKYKKDAENVEEVTLSYPTTEQKTNGGEGRRGEAYDDDEEHQRGGEGVQCRQQ